MPIDFFTAPCGRQDGNCKKPGIICKSTTAISEFGLCDDPPPSNFPAYIDTENQAKWIAVVKNPDLKEVTFKAIDNCVPLIRADGQSESRCDGMLEVENTLKFIELKDRGTSHWLSKGRKQLTVTIQIFRANHEISKYKKVEAYVCNKQRPLAVTGNNTEVQQFKNDTGLLLKASRSISI